jgi:TolB-like protein/DNA-binding winged helix-turn-helix (wHTH) protein
MRLVEDASLERGGQYTSPAREVLPWRGIFSELFLNAAMRNGVKHFYEFGPFRLDPCEHTLWRDGRVVPLRPKVFDILLVLVERHGHLVEKDELMRLVWEEQFVEEGNLNKNVSMLRQTLGEDPATHQYIETVPKRGYRFAAAVRTVNGGEDAELVVETRARASLLVEEETDDEPPSGVGGSLVADAVVVKPTTGTAAAPAQLASKSERRLRSWAIPAAAVIIALAAVVVYLFYPKGGGEAIDSVAVLPFVNVSGDPEVEYLSDGISDSVINSLSRLPELRVISLSSVVRYKGRQVDPQAVGRELNVRAVLVGRLVQRGDGLAISTELVDVRDRRRLWGGQYNRKLSDLLAVQEEIAGEIAEKLRLRLGGAEKQRLSKYYTESVEAYQAYLRGRYLLDKRTEQTAEKSIEHFEQAVKFDPNYALAYADLGYAYWSLSNLGPRARKEVNPRAKEAVAKALAIDDTLAEAHTSLGFIRVTDYDWMGAEGAHKRAIELNPNSGYAHQGYAHYLRVMRRFDEAIAESKRAVELEPTSVIFNRDVGMMLYFARRYDEAIEQCQKTLELDPNMVTVYGWLGGAYEQKGLYDQAIAAYLRARELSRMGPEVAPLREAYAASGWKGYWRKALDLAKERATQRHVYSDEFAEIYARLGEKDQAFIWLEKAYEERRWAINTINSDPTWDGLRSDPRYAELLRRMNLEP